MKWFGKRVIWVAGCVLLLIFGVISQYPQVLTVGNWGLGFDQEGEPPSGSASSDSLSQWNACYLGDTSQPVIYLTFDAGFENGQTSGILDVLQAQQVPACFFLVGNYLETEPDLVRRMVAEGHTVGNHTYHHYDMSQLGSFEDFSLELELFEEKYLEIVGQPLEKYYRPPQGIYSQENLEMASQLGYATVFWSLAYVDWYQDNQPTHEEAFSKLLPRVHNGAVVLLHATSQTNGEILDELLTKWKEMGFTFGKISDLFTGALHDNL